MSVMKEIKKQIDSQTRTKIGSVKLQTQSSLFSEEGATNWNIGRTGEPPIVIWNKTSYSMDRGVGFPLNPQSFNNPASQISNQLIPTITGNFRETNTIPLYNCRYSGWAGISGGGTVSLQVRTGNSNVSIWIDNQEFMSRYITTFEPIEVEFNIGDLTLIEIFWYSYTENNSISVVGNLSHQISSWATTDSSPFFRPVEWYTEDPITSDAMWQFGLDNYIGLKWWFNIAEEVEEDPVTDPVTGDPPIQDQPFTYEGIADLGGFGVWSIDFQEAGPLDYIDGDTISVSGYYPSATYIRIPTIVGDNGEVEGKVWEVEYLESFNRETNISTFFITAHGIGILDEGRVVEVGTMRNVAEVAFSTLGGVVTDVFETVENGLIRGERYYYLIDTFDSSSNKNRGGMTATYQTIIAGDYTAPVPVTSLTGVRNSVSSITLNWDDSNQYVIKRFNIYSDANSADFTALEIARDYFYISSYTALEAAWIASNGEMLISVEDVSGSNKYIRKVSYTSGGMFAFVTQIPEMTGSAIIRILSLIDTVNNAPPRLPIVKPPRLITAE